jgi:hypothetical protein
MKTKIVYISGSEVFDVTYIRSAFEKVRSTLGLSSDTILFGVPVDANDAGLAVDWSAKTPDVSDIEKAEKLTEEIPQSPIIEESTPETIPEEAAAPVIEKPKRGRKPKTSQIELEQEALANKAPDAIETPAAGQEKVIPILSILSGKADAARESSIIAPLEVNEIGSVAVEKVVVKNAAEKEIITTEKVDIEDIASMEEPESGLEKTLEQLLEKMAPLREDITEGPDTVEYAAPATEDADDTEENAGADESEVDATLEQLATEFATKQDEIVSTPDTPPVGKIGKLKNILPFKKAKREESGLMGDLFGWAGIAANDDEFSIPGFFTAEASKK